MIGYLALGVALGGCGGGGGGGGGPSTGVGFTTQASAGSEGAAVIAVVELSTSKASLGQDLQVTLAGTGTSSAADHDFVDRVLTFPAGSVDGDTLPVTVNLVDDGLVEGGDETLILALSAPTQGGLGGGFGARTHAITLQETDFAQLAFTAATSATAARGRPPRAWTSRPWPRRCCGSPSGRRTEPGSGCPWSASTTWTRRVTRPSSCGSRARPAAPS